MRLGNAPPQPLNLVDLQIPNEYRQSLNDDAFLLYDSGAANDRILIFSTRRNLQLLSRSEHWYADGTFKVVPSIFTQLYTIHAFIEKECILSGSVAVCFIWRKMCTEKWKHLVCSSDFPMMPNLCSE